MPNYSIKLFHSMYIIVLFKSKNSGDSGDIKNNGDSDCQLD